MTKITPEHAPAETTDGDAWKVTFLATRTVIEAALVAHEDAYNWDPEIVIAGSEIAPDRPEDWQLEVWLSHKPSRAELAAKNQGAYDRMHMALMTGTSAITDDVIKAATLKLGLDWPRLQADMSSQDVQDRIDANLAMAKRLDLQGTPAYAVGDMLLPGAVDLAELQHAVDAARQAN